ncbi:MAG: amidase [Proteobacteria bacterium]|nr:amidase [Pseudomonadota bacterium]
MSGDLTALTVTELAGLIRRRKVSAIEAVEASLAQVARWQPRLNSFIEIEADAARRAARRLDRALARSGPVGPLHGVPLAHKDMFYRKGKVCSAGSKIRRDWVAPYTATVMARLEAAGAICLGRLHMAEFAADASGHNAEFGPCRNPWNPAHIPGGSSGGSGASVAARAVFAALGSDTGGSVRLPAAANGVIGLMPTYGRVSRYGAIPRAWSLDHVGVLSHTALDAARIARVIAGEDPEDATTSRLPVPNYEAAAKRGIKGLRIGVAAGAFAKGVAPEVAKLLEESLTVLKSRGARLVPVEMPDPLPLFAFNDLILKCEGATVHGRWLHERPGDFSVFLRKRLEGGLLIPATHYLAAMSWRARALADFLATVMDKVDAVHTPVIPIPVPTLREMNPNRATPEMLNKVAALANFTRWTNYIGVPAITVPCGFTKNGLPASFQIVTRPFDEETLFATAHAYQEATDWHTMAPALPRAARA